MEEIYQKYSKLVYNYLHKLTNDVELSEELMKETFYSAIKGINKFKGDTKITVWLCQIAKNKWKDYITKSKKLKSTSLEEAIGELFIEDNTLNELSSREEIIHLYKYINKLPEEVKDVFYLRMKGEFSFKEIGMICGKSEEWARVTFYRGKLKLKEELLKNEK